MGEIFSQSKMLSKLPLIQNKEVKAPALTVATRTKRGKVSAAALAAAQKRELKPVPKDVPTVCGGKTVGKSCPSNNANFGVDSPCEFDGSYIVNLFEGEMSKTLKVKVQLEGQFGQDPNGGDPNPQYLQVYGPTYEVELKVVRKNSFVTLYIPAISVSIPDAVIDPDTGGTIYGGPSYLIISGCFIPEKFRPTSMAGVSFAVGSNVTDNPPTNPAGFPATPMYQGTIYRNGIFRYALQGGYPIPPGQLIADATWVSYVSNPFFVPGNFLISTWGRSDTVLPVLQGTPTNPVPPTTYPYTPPPPFVPGTVIDYQTQAGGYYEYNYIKFHNGRIYALWADNSHTPSTVTVTFPGTTTPPQVWPGFGINGAFSRFRVKEEKCKGKCKLSIKQEICPYYPWGPEQGNFFQTESGLAVNPLDPNIVVAVVSLTPVPFFYPQNLVPVTPLVSNGVAYLYSTDGGKSFAEYTQFGVGFLGITTGVFGYDQGLSFDRFGNLWFTALSATPDFEVPLIAYTFVTPMGNPSGWRLIKTYGVPGFPTGQSVDYPRSKTGPGYPDGHPTADGGPPEAHWTSMFLNPTIVPDDVGEPNLLTGIQIYGPVSPNPSDTTTNIGPIVQFRPPSTASGQPADYLIGIGGDVLLISTGGGDSGLLSSNVNYEVMYCNYNPQGVYGQFGNRQNIGYISEGGAESIGPMIGSGISPYPHLVGARIQGETDRSHSRYRGRRYVVFIDKKEITPELGYTPDTPSNKQIIGLTWSDNNGASWADPIRINNDVRDDNSHFNPCMDIDQSTGNIVVAYYDARTDKKNQAVNWVGAIITPDDIYQIEKRRKSVP